MLSAILTIFTFSLILAQSGNQDTSKKLNLSTEQKASIALKKMTRSLGLSNSQQQKIKTLLVESIKKRKEHKANRESKNKTVTQTNEKFKQKKAFQKKMKSILTKKQFKKWKKKKKKEKERKSKMKRMPAIERN